MNINFEKALKAYNQVIELCQDIDDDEFKNELLSIDYDVQRASNAEDITNSISNIILALENLEEPCDQEIYLKIEELYIDVYENL